MGLPVGLFVFELEGLPCLRTGGNGQWMQCLAGMSVLRDCYLVPFRDSSLPLPSIVYDIPGVLASGSSLGALLLSMEKQLLLVLLRRLRLWRLRLLVASVPSSPGRRSR